MLKLLQKMGRRDEPVEFVCLLGKYPMEWDEPDGPEKVKNTLLQLRGRIVLYDELLDNAYESYKDYLEKKKTVDRLSKLIKAIDDYAPPEN